SPRNCHGSRAAIWNWSWAARCATGSAGNCRGEKSTLSQRSENAMLIVDAQVHIWSAGPPTNAAHRQVTSYTAEECIRDMDAAGVNACLLHPPGWDPNSGKIS